MADFRLGNSAIASTNKEQAGIKPATTPKTSFWNREIEISRPLSGKEKMHFYQMLSILMESGLSISESMEVLIDQTRKKGSKNVLEKIQQLLNEGQSLYHAVSLHPKVFSSFEIASIRMGEAGGKMVTVLRELAVYHEKRQRLSRKLSQAFSYPAIVLFIAGAVLAFMMSFVVPMFEDTFKRFGAELPVLTQKVIAISDFIRGYGFYLVVLVLLMTFILFSFRKTDRFRKISSGFIRKIPLIGKLIFKMQLSRFCYTLSLMLKSKVALESSLELLEGVIQYYPIQTTLAQIRKDVVSGKTLYEAFSRHAIFPVLLLQMVKVGERTARLEVMMENLGKTLEEESESGISTLTGLLEPLLIVILGLVVGVILVAMYLPMFQLSKVYSV